LPVLTGIGIGIPAAAVGTNTSSAAAATSMPIAFDAHLVISQSPRVLIWCRC
jgi:hypothetical protein